jgi:hypothetical protein
MYQAQAADAIATARYFAGNADLERYSIRQKNTD